MNTNPKNNGIADMKALRKELLDAIAAAVRQEDGAAIFNATERLRRFDALLVEAHSLVKTESKNLEQKISSPALAKPSYSNSTFSHESIKDRKEKGERVRIEWIEKLSKLGRVLTQVRGALYQNAEGDIVGVAVAREKESRRNLWWLGLTHGKFQRAALLCVPNAGDTFAVCLPRGFLEEQGSRLTKTRAGQTHFTVIKRGSKVFLAGVDVTSYVNSYSLIA